MKILLADDSSTIVDVLQFLLQSQGYDVITASDGIAAISKTYETHPDLVLLDIEMPKMNGYQVCRLLKSDEVTKSIPIIILTSRDQKQDRFWGFAAGADEFVSKDFESEEELFAIIQQVLERTTPLRNTSQEFQAEKIPQTPPYQSTSVMRFPITEMSVLEHVNHILDRQLFQATIVNELSYLAIDMHSSFTMINSLFSLLAKVCEFHIAAIFLRDIHAYNLFLYIMPPVSRHFLENVKQQVIAEYKKYHPIEPIENIEITILKDKQGVKNAAKRDDVATFFALPLKVRNTVTGVLALGSSRDNAFHPDSIDTLQVFTNEASIVLDNAMLFKQLEQSNRELEKTITKLRNTQAQLVQSEKMASLGQLVAGVAHEINTPAGAINAATGNLMHVLHTFPDSFRRLITQHISKADQDLLLLLISQIIHAGKEQRKSMAAIRQDTKEIERLLMEDGVENARIYAKQIARFSLKEGYGELFQLLKRYSTEQILDFLEHCSKIVGAASDINMSIEIITRIVKALKMYSRLDQAKVEEVDIHEGIETTLIILQSHFKAGITVERCYGNIPKIPCYVNELNQVWTNIIHNAIQAMNGHGTLTIETYLYPKETGTLNHGNDMFDSERDERKIGVTITDTGPGIPLEIQDKVFDPYFTTKDQGEGSGLGLGIARQIVEHHHGEIRLRSTPGETHFDILLPMTGVQQVYLAS